MSPVIFHSIWTVMMLILFIGIVFWAYSSRRKRAFDEYVRSVFAADRTGERKGMIEVIEWT